MRVIEWKEMFENGMGVVRIVEKLPSTGRQCSTFFHCSSSQHLTSYTRQQRWSNILGKHHRWIKKRDESAFNLTTRPECRISSSNSILRITQMFLLTTEEQKINTQHSRHMDYNVKWMFFTIFMLCLSNRAKDEWIENRRRTRENTHNICIYPTYIFRCLI